MEGRNPALIKEVFAPDKVLDVGCGPGFLMLLLHELGVDVRGIDYAEASLTLAPAEIRDRIAIAETSDFDYGEREFDLVVCREVFEHLTVLQVRETVRQICRASSRFVYVDDALPPRPGVAAGLHDAVRRRPDAHHPDVQGLPARAVRARGIPAPPRPRAADGLGRQKPRPRLRARDMKRDVPYLAGFAALVVVPLILLQLVVEDRMAIPGTGKARSRSERASRSRRARPPRLRSSPRRTGRSSRARRSSCASRSTASSRARRAPSTSPRASPTFT